jgi:SNF2 family DNA or RNA helicase
MIKKKYIWLLTGTPIQNRLSDLESYFKLLQYKDHGLLKAKVKKGFVKNNKSLLLIK